MASSAGSYERGDESDSPYSRLTDIRCFVIDRKESHVKISETIDHFASAHFAFDSSTCRWRAAEFSAILPHIVESLTQTTGPCHCSLSCKLEKEE